MYWNSEDFKQNRKICIGVLVFYCESCRLKGKTNIFLGGEEDGGEDKRMIK